jgi:hypothetical protein
MEILIVLCALGAAAWYFFRNNAKRGLEIVRAQEFLSGVHSGNTVSDANYAASFGAMEHLPPEIVQSAAALARAEYDGRTLPIIAEAYQRGLKPALPIWQRIIILGSFRSPYQNFPSRARRHATL